MLLTVLDPDSRDVFRVAIVDRVVDQAAFLVSLLERPEVRLVCRGDSEHIVPISWAIGQGFLDKASLQTMSCSPLSRIAPRSLFLALGLPAVPHRAGQAMELCTDPDTLEFRRAVVEEVKGRVVRVAVRGLGSRFTTSASLDNFPEGWCRSNGLTLVGEELEEEEMDEQGEERQMEAVAPLPLEVGSSWCPPIYFNHLCYSASFLSRHRLESLPRCIGAGPVRLVLREVLSRLIRSSFKSGAVLRKLEVGERPRPGYWVEVMKGKSRVLHLQAEVEIPSLASQVAPFCREVCQKLSCCPYLFGPQLVGEECPSACNSRPKSDFHAASGDGRLRRGAKRGRRGRGPVEATGQQTPGAASSSGSSPSASPTPSTTVTTCTTRESSPCPGTLASTPTSGQVETLQRILAERCQEEEEEEEREASPPPRPPSPKLLRSKSSLTALAPRPEEQGRPGTRAPSPRARGLQAAFTLDLEAPCPALQDAPAVRRVTLASNPLSWSPGQVAAYMEQQEDVAGLAQLFLQDQVDGQALLLLNLPSVLDHWQLRLGEAVLLARHIESIKLAFYMQFAFAEMRAGMGEEVQASA